jgi:hypothetical protein
MQNKATKARSPSGNRDTRPTEIQERDQYNRWHYERHNSQITAYQKKIAKSAPEPMIKMGSNCFLRAIFSSK